MDTLLVERSDAITTLTLNRPDKANALDSTLVDAMLAAVERAFEDGTRLLVLKGQGKHFCAGFDFTGFEEHSEGDLLLRFVRIEQLLQALWHAPIATVALVHGSCFGAGADLVCSCERRIAAPGSRFRMPGLRFGLALGTRRLAARIGAAEARSLLAGSAIFLADEALAVGFIDAIAGDAEWTTEIDTIATEACALSREARATLQRLTTPDTIDADLADLVRTASAPGLKGRIRAFRAAAG
jgi:enoyl-CoA hydratase